jgi:hypothetical protein
MVSKVFIKADVDALERSVTESVSSSVFVEMESMIRAADQSGD